MAFGWALPDDHTIDALADATRSALGAHWTKRSSAELSVSLAFALLRPRLRGAGAASVVLALVDKAVDDERRHAELCAALAGRYRGVAPEAPVPRTTDPNELLPRFGAEDERDEVALLVTGMCCINESIASEWIRSAYAAATSPLAQYANREHLKDEIDHARLGWAHLASSALDAGARARLARWVPRLLASNVAEWKRPDPDLPPEGLPEFGHLANDVACAAIDAAVADVILPGFAHVGVRL